jgi:carboxyl-terminal processing protease
VVLPERDPTLGGELELLQLELAGFEAELGAPVEFSPRDPGQEARWLLRLAHDHDGPATVEVDPTTRTIVSSATDVAGLFESMNFLRTAVRVGQRSAATDCSDSDEAISRVVEEVADTYPSFELRGLDWSAVCARHTDVVRSSEDLLPAFQQRLAELQDGHTWVWELVGNLPYAVRVDETATFVRVLEGTNAYAVGVRPGWLLQAIDEVPVDATGWLARAAAPPHSHALIAGRRLLAGPVGAADVRPRRTLCRGRRHSGGRGPRRFGRGRPRGRRRAVT